MFSIENKDIAVYDAAEDEQGAFDAATELSEEYPGRKFYISYATRPYATVWWEDGSIHVENTYKSVEAAKQRRTSQHIRYRGAVYRLADTVGRRAVDPYVPGTTMLHCSEHDYRGRHLAPGKGRGAPLWDVTQDVYPEDIYSANGIRYYGDNTKCDYISMDIMRKYRNKPNSKVKIYRAVPADNTVTNQIKQYEKDLKHMRDWHELPADVHTDKFTFQPDLGDEWSQYYEWLEAQIEELKRTPRPPKTKLAINPGDWVAICRPYAVTHGRGNLRDNYTIISKTVYARDVWTNGDSFNEWGYDPQPAVPTVVQDKSI